ncbi:hypothetical protein CALVIDRAFT_110332 [Calocera viscosa TUFC12733]|uniref:Uncharacterized protein n=1 Tax=Calocera viscosa (strain TUFC12733) TaxID=1330018 RepID=A0A167MGG1_CALVF|nr:hypothetical protein CALVIDRAFT_110332 [Calocera viscosa TUFC12733]
MVFEQMQAIRRQSHTRRCRRLRYVSRDVERVLRSALILAPFWLAAARALLSFLPGAGCSWQKLYKNNSLALFSCSLQHRDARAAYCLRPRPTRVIRAAWWGSVRLRPLSPPRNDACRPAPAGPGPREHTVSFLSFPNDLPKQYDSSASSTPPPHLVSPGLTTPLRFVARCAIIYASPDRVTPFLRSRAALLSPFGILSHLGASRYYTNTKNPIQFPHPSRCVAPSAPPSRTHLAGGSFDHSMNIPIVPTSSPRYARSRPRRCFFSGTQIPALNECGSLRASGPVRLSRASAGHRGRHIMNGSPLRTSMPH